MYFDAWINAIPAEWESLEEINNNNYSEEISNNNYSYHNSITGYWKDSGPYQVYNVIGTQQEIQEIIDALTDVESLYAWIQGDGLDSLDQWPTDPAPVLAVMKDHVEYDGDRNIISTTPATFENPNWGHVFFGQVPRIFAGDFTDDFSGDFL